MADTRIAVVLFATVVFFAGEASAKGCLAGAAVGGTAGHFAGHHSFIGAGVGCAVGRHRANKKDKEAAAAANQQGASNIQPTPAHVQTVPSK